MFFLFAGIFWLTVLLILGALILGLCICLVLGLLILLIISTLVAVNFRSRRVALCIKALFLLVASILGAGIGLAISLLLVWLNVLPLAQLPYGIVAGLLLGLLTGLVFNALWGWCVDWIAGPIPDPSVKLSPDPEPPLNTSGIK